MNEDQLNELQRILVAILSPNNSQREFAEKSFHSLFATRTNELVFGLIQHVRLNPQPQVRSLATVLLRQSMPVGEPIVFDTLPPQLQLTVKQELLHALTQETTRIVRNQLGEAVAELASVLLYRDLWPELVPFLFRTSTAQNEALFISCLSILGKLCVSSSAAMAKFVRDILRLYADALNLPSLKVRSVAAVCACNTLTNCIEAWEESNYSSLQEAFIPPLFVTIHDCIEMGNQDGVVAIMTAMVDLAQDEPNFFRAHLVATGQALLGIVQRKSIDNSLRHMALEVMVTITESAPGMVRKCADFITPCVHAALSLMLCVHDEATWASVRESDEMENPNVDCGEVSIDRVAVAIESARLTPIVCPIIHEFLASAEWRFRFAGLRALSQVGEVLDFELIASSLDPVSRFVLNLEEHPRVRYAAITCIGQLASDFGPKFQTDLHQVALPALMAPLYDMNALPRLQERSLSALFNFFDNVPEENVDLVDNYVQELMGHSIQLLEHGHLMVREQAMTLIASIAGKITTGFLPYYNRVVPLLKTVVATATDRKLLDMRSRAMESVTFIGLAVGPENFRNDAAELVKIFSQIMEGDSIAADDTTIDYMLSSWTRICTALGREFVPYLPLIIPHVFRAARKTVDIPRTRGFSATYKASLGISEALNLKATGCSMIYSFLHVLREDYLPYIAETLDLMRPLMRFYNPKVRSYAINCQPDILQSVVSAYDAKMCDFTMVSQVFATVIQALLQCFETEAETSHLLILVGALHMCMNIVWDVEGLSSRCMDQKALDTVGRALLSLLANSHTKINLREEKTKLPDFDEEQMYQIQRLNEEEDELHTMVADCVGSLVKTHTVTFLPTFQTVFPEIMTMLEPHMTATTRQTAVCILDDVIDALGIQASAFFPHFVPVLISYCSDPDPDLRQACAYGIAMLASKGEEHFTPFLDSALAALLAGVSDPAARDEDAAQSTDNMIAALGQIAEFRQRPDLWPKWLSLLPLTADYNEGFRTYSTLCLLVEQNQTALLGRNMENLPKVVSVLLYVLDDEDWTDPKELRPRMLNLLQQLQHLSQSMAHALMRGLSPQEQQKLHLVFSQSTTSAMQ